MFNQNFIHFLSEVAKVCAVIGTIVGTIFPLWRYAIKPKIILPIKRTITEIHSISSIQKKMDSFHSIIGPNGGKSLYDRLVKLDHKVSISIMKDDILSTSLNLIYFTTDNKGLVLTVGSSLIDILHISPIDFINNNWIAHVDEDIRDIVWQEWKQAIENERIFKLKVIFNTNNSKKNVLISAKPVFDSTNEFIGYVGLMVKE